MPGGASKSALTDGSAVAECHPKPVIRAFRSISGQTLAIRTKLSCGGAVSSTRLPTEGALCRRPNAIIRVQTASVRF